MICCLLLGRILNPTEICASIGCDISGERTVSQFLEMLMNFANRLCHLYRPDVTPQQEQADDQPDTEPGVGQTALERRQETLAHIVRLVARGKSQGAVIFGERGGLGKTRVVMRTLREEGHSPVNLNGHCTSLALYENLFKHPSGIIVLDDCEALARNISSLGILRSALWGETQSRRLVSYISSQIKLPTSFYFSGRIILICNVLPKNSPRSLPLNDSAYPFSQGLSLR